MTIRKYTMLGMALALGACSGAGEEEGGGEPAALMLTPGAWAANDEQASYADDDGNLLASFRCDAETAELVLEMPGDFAEGARQAMALRAGDFMHGVDPVERGGTAEAPLRIARLPVGGPLTGAIRSFPVPLTIEAEGAEPVMVETDTVLQGYFESCAEASGSTAGSPVEPAE